MGWWARDSLKKTSLFEAHDLMSHTVKFAVEILCSAINFPCVRIFRLIWDNAWEVTSLF